jgi:hypothetical protein
MHKLLSLPRLVAIGMLLAAVPAAVVLPRLVGLAGLVLIMAALIVVETTRHAQTRRNLRGAQSPASRPGYRLVLFAWPRRSDDVGPQPDRRDG